MDHLLLSHQLPFIVHHRDHMLLTMPTLVQGCIVMSYPTNPTLSPVTGGSSRMCHGCGTNPVLDCPSLPYQFRWQIVVVQYPLTLGINRSNTLSIILSILLGGAVISDSALLLLTKLSPSTSPSKSLLLGHRIVGTLRWWR